ncbi:MAG TPA: alkaline phosphatase family protein [Gemmataceae bacterium]|nr:alkaline phosphatase family protein [Gemmataceae bacterium]
MLRRSRTIVVVLLGLISITAIMVGREPDPAARRVLPGVSPDGYIQLWNQWKLRPTGTQVELDDFPVHIEMHPSGEWLAILHAGYGEHEIAILSTKGARPRSVSRVRVDQTFYGLCFAPDGKSLYASGGEYEVVHRFDFDDGYLSKPKALRVAPQLDKFVPGGLAIDAAGKTLFVCGTFGDALVRLPLDKPEDRVRIPFTSRIVEGKKQNEAYPYACLLDSTGKRLFVSLWNRAAVAVIDTDSNKVVQDWPCEKHPTEMALSPDGKKLFVACANSTKVSVLDTETGKGFQTLSAALYPKAPVGNTPNSICLSPDGKLLFVANADANNIAVFNVEKEAVSLGFIPVGQYPTSVRMSQDKRIYVANGKGIFPKANRHGPNNNLPSNISRLDEYIGGIFRGCLSIIDMPSPQQMELYTKRAYACSPLREDNGTVGDVPADNPIPARLGDSSPIKHVIYIIKENRTYDQVFGDMKEGNGDPDLCLFPDGVTPNHHKLAREFVLLDNIYCDGEVSADGHHWSMGAYATDFVEKYWPLSYRGSPFKKFTYPSEGNLDDIARGAEGYVWDRCAQANVSYRSYGEWTESGKTEKDPSKPLVPALVGHIDEWFRGWDLDYPDQKRADRFIEELDGFSKKGEMPSLIILRLPNDHTEGTRVGKLTPKAMVADNDLALGRVVEAISKSPFWKDTAIFVIEDDAQNGPDHVDAHRVLSLVISPYTKHHFVDSELYSTTSMLRTMELILGLQPMSQFDAAARPMYNSFQPKPDVTPYAHVVPAANLNEKNLKTAWGADLSEQWNFAKEDMVDDLLLNEVIWRSIKGADVKMPPPTRAAFFRPKLKKDDD